MHLPSDDLTITARCFWGREASYGSVDSHCPMSVAMYNRMLGDEGELESHIKSLHIYPYE